jgi:hypothetical protein
VSTEPARPARPARTSGLHTIPDPDRPGAWHVMVGRRGAADATRLGAVARTGPTSWVCQPAQGDPFGWTGTRDEAALAVAEGPDAVPRRRPARTSTARPRPRTVDAVPSGAGRESLFIAVDHAGRSQLTYRANDGTLHRVDVAGDVSAVDALRELLATTVPVIDTPEETTQL